MGKEMVAIWEDASLYFRGPWRDLIERWRGRKGRPFVVRFRASSSPTPCQTWFKLSSSSASIASHSLLQRSFVTICATHRLLARYSYRSQEYIRRRVSWHTPNGFQQSSQFQPQDRVAFHRSHLPLRMYGDSTPPTCSPISTQVDQLPLNYEAKRHPTLLCVHGFPDFWYA